MKTVLSSLLAACLVGLAGCASAPRATLPPSAAAPPLDHLFVISAVYGSGVKYADVTWRVTDLLHQPGAQFFARPEWLDADPTPGWNKALVIVYEYKGERRIFSTGEGGKVSFDQLVKKRHGNKRK